MSHKVLNFSCTVSLLAQLQGLGSDQGKQENEDKTLDSNLGSGGHTELSRETGLLHTANQLHLQISKELGQGDRFSYLSRSSLSRGGVFRP